MIEVLHVTNTVNLKSIFEKGLLCFKPSLPHHEKCAKKRFSNYHKRGLIYTIPYGCNKMDKYLKDTAYWRVWGRPRNDALEISYDEFSKHLNDGSKYFEIMEKQLTNEDHFSILSIEVPEFVERLDWTHEQTHDMSNYYMDMDCSFEHKDKPLFMFNENLKYKMKVIGTIETQRKRNKKIEVNLRGF
jgi:hypothetical protein